MNFWIRFFKRRTRAAAMAAVIASVTLSSIPADACSCRPPVSPAAARDAADAVFEGRAGTPVVAKTAGPGLSPTGMSVPFTVLRAVKGVKAGEKLTIATSGSTATCGYPFAAGETYLVYAYRDKNGSLGTGLCSRTRKSADAADDFAAFAAPATTAPAASAEPAASPSGTASAEPAVSPSGTASATEPPKEPPGGNSNAMPGNTTESGSSEPPAGISVEPGVPPAEAPSGGCAACALKPSNSEGILPELAVLLGIAALAGRIAGRKR